jgi:SAM-dependent methyltransferase
MEVRALRHSTSRKMTAPIHWCSMGIRRCAEGIRSVIVGVFRMVYHSLPFAIQHKNILKDRLYSTVPLLFRHTISYRYWKLNKQADALTPKSDGLQNELKDQRLSHNFSKPSSHSDNPDAYVPLKKCQKQAQGVVAIEDEISNSQMIDQMSDMEVEQVDKAHDEWFNIICKSMDNSLVRYKGNTLPGFPDAQTQINSVGAAGKSILIEAYVFFQDVVRHINSSPNWKSNDKVILDFGCGWGRIARFFMLYFKPENIFGIDIDEELLNICRSTFNGSKFYKCQAFPPTTLENDSIDFIVGYSVFSHLSERACHQWMGEFKRILKSGGIVALTTRGRPFFDYCISLKGTKQSGYPEALSRIFDDFDMAKRRYDAGEFVHSNVMGVTGGGVREAEFYGESFIPESYARDVLSKYLTFLAFSFDSHKSIHPTIYFKKE